MTISQAQYVDLLVKKLYGVSTTDTAENKSPSNESIVSPALNRGDTVWTQANDIPTVAANVANLSYQYGNSNPIQCTPDTTSVPILNSQSQLIYPTWLTNIPEWIPPEFGGSYAIQAYVGAPNIANLSSANVTFISSSGEGNIANPGEFYFDYQAGLLYFIGETIPNVLTTGNVVYITGYQYTGLTGVTNLPDNTNIGNITITDSSIASVGNNLVTFNGNSGVVIPSGNTTQRPGNANIGTTRFNTTVNSLETWDGAEWISGGNILTPGTITDQQITPDGTSNTYTLNQTTTSVGVLVSINGVTQLPDVAYSISGNSITFTQTPLTQDTIDVRYISYSTTISALTNGSGNASVTITPAGNILLTTNGNVLTTMSGNNVAIAGGLSVTGNITTSGYFVGTFAGNVSGNVVAPGSNTQVIYNNNGNLGASAGFTFDQSSNAITISGNITSANISTSGKISATGNITGGNISGTNLSGSLTTAAQGNITSVGTLSSLTVNGNTSSGNILTAGLISATGNGTVSNLSVGGNATVTGNITSANVNPSSNAVYSLGNVTNQWKSLYVSGNTIYIGGANITSDGNSISINGSAVAVTGTPVDGDLLVNGVVSATGNVTGNYFVGNGSQLTGIIAVADYSNSNVASYLPTYSGNITAGNVSATGNITGNYVLGNGALLTGIVANTTYSNSNVASYLPTYSGNITAGNVSATGNITGNYFIGNGSQLTGIVANSSYSNSNVASYLPTYSGNITAGNVSATGNITVSYIFGNGSQLTGISGGSTAANVLTGNTLSSNVLFSSLTSTGTLSNLSVSGNTTSGNVLTAGTISAAGNITGNYFIGNGSQLTGISISSVSANTLTGNTLSSNVSISSLTTIGTLGNLSVSGNTTTGNLLTAGLISATGNATAGNITTAGLISAAGNITSNNIYTTTSLGVGTAPSGTAGEIRATNNITAFYSSDAKFKENVQPILNALDIVDTVGGKLFDWTDEYIANKGGEDGYFVQKSDFGIIAQDLEKVFPLATRQREDGTLAVDYPKLVAIAFAAISELREEINKLKKSQ